MLSFEMSWHQAWMNKTPISFWNQTKGKHESVSSKKTCGRTLTLDINFNKIF